MAVAAGMFVAEGAAVGVAVAVWKTSAVAEGKGVEDGNAGVTVDVGTADDTGVIAWATGEHAASSDTSKMQTIQIDRVDLDGLHINLFLFHIAFPLVQMNIVDLSEAAKVSQRASHILHGSLSLGF